jgi:hypothetical protein
LTLLYKVTGCIKNADIAREGTAISFTRKQIYKVLFDLPFPGIARWNWAATSKQISLENLCVGEVTKSLCAKEQQKCKMVVVASP